MTYNMNSIISSQQILTFDNSREKYHSSLDRSADLGQISHLISMPCLEWTAESGKHSNLLQFFCYIKWIVHICWFIIFICSLACILEICKNRGFCEYDWTIESRLYELSDGIHKKSNKLAYLTNYIHLFVLILVWLVEKKHMRENNLLACKILGSMMMVLDSTCQ
jgi:hypothetical protein